MQFVGQTGEDTTTGEDRTMTKRGKGDGREQTGGTRQDQCSKQEGIDLKREDESKNDGKN